MRSKQLLRLVSFLSVGALMLFGTLVSVGAENVSSGAYSGNTGGYTQYTDYTQVATNWFAFASSTSQDPSTYIFTTVKGFNNGLGWHNPQTTGCNQPSYSNPQSCSTGVINYDTTPDSRSTDRYAAAQHFFPDAGVTLYSSTDANHSNINCYMTAGC